MKLQAFKVTRLISDSFIYIDIDRLLFSILLSFSLKKIKIQFSRVLANPIYACFQIDHYLSWTIIALTN